MKLGDLNLIFWLATFAVAIIGAVINKLVDEVVAILKKQENFAYGTQWEPAVLSSTQCY